MDDKPEDWEKLKRIKAERDKALKESNKLKENPANLSYLDAKSFAAKKGFSTRPEAFLNSGERMASISVILAALGILGDKILEYFKQSVMQAGSANRTAENDAALRAIGYLQSSFQFLLILAFLLAIAAIASAIWYYYKTKKRVWHIFISAGIAIGIFFLNQGLTLLIAKLLHS